MPVMTYLDLLEMDNIEFNRIIDGSRWHENTSGVHGYDPGADPCRAGRAGESENQGADRNGE